MTGTSASGAFTIDFAGVERIYGPSSPSAVTVSGLAAVQSFEYFPSGSDRITGGLRPDEFYGMLTVTYSRGGFNTAGISLSYDAQGIGKVTSSAFPTAGGDTLERVISINGTAVADVFDMRNFGMNPAGSKLNIIGVSAGDTVYGNGQTRLVLPGYALNVSLPAAGTSVTAPDFTRRVVIDLQEGSFEAFGSTVSNNNFNAWGGAVKFSGVEGLYGSSQDETMLGDERDNFFRTEDGDDFVDGRGGDGHGVRGLVRREGFWGIAGDQRG